MDTTEVQERLQRQQQAWENATDEAPPDGDYQATVLRFDVFDAPGKGLFLKIVYQIANDNQYAGREVEQVQSLEGGPERLKFTRQTLATLGMDVASTPLSEVYPGSAALSALLDVPVDIAVKRSTKTREDGSPYVNVFLNRRLGGPLRESDVGDDPSFTHPRGKPDETLDHDGTPIEF